MSIGYAAVGQAPIAALYGADQTPSSSTTPPKRRTAAKADVTVSPSAL